MEWLLTDGAWMRFVLGVLVVGLLSLYLYGPFTKRCFRSLEGVSLILGAFAPQIFLFPDEAGRIMAGIASGPPLFRENLAHPELMALSLALLYTAAALGLLPSLWRAYGENLWERSRIGSKN